MMERAASATNDASLSSEPYCFEAMTGLRADTRVSCVKGDGRLKVDSSVTMKYRSGCHHITAFQRKRQRKLKWMRADQRLTQGFA